MKIVIVIPTYNEAENIGKLIEALDLEVKRLNHHNVSVLFVDGNSPDNTSGKIRDLAVLRPWVHLLIEQKKEGLGAGYFKGFKYAMYELGAEIIVEMDADLQHDPADISRLLDPIERGADYVIGSRFVRGGSIPKEWAFYRKLLSIGGSYFAKLVFGIPSVDDYTSGFKASRVKGFVDKINFDELKNKGFAYKIELLFTMHNLGAKIAQVPITFGVRDRGFSKMENNNLIESLFTVLRLRFSKRKEFVKFSIVGGAGFVTDTSIFNVLMLFTTIGGYAPIVSGGVAMVVTFLLNNFWSFNTRTKTKFSELAKSFPIYAGVSAVPILLRGKMVTLTLFYFGDNFYYYNTAFLIGILFGLIWNYLIYSKVIWKKKK